MLLPLDPPWERWSKGVATRKYPSAQRERYLLSKRRFVGAERCSPARFSNSIRPLMHGYQPVVAGHQTLSVRICKRELTVIKITVCQVVHKRRQLGEQVSP